MPGETQTTPPTQKLAGATSVSDVPKNGATSTTADDLERKKRETEIKARGAALKAEKDALNKQRAEVLSEQKKLAEEKKQLEEFNKWRSSATVDPDAFLTPVYGKDWRDKLAKATAGDTTPLAIQQLREEFEKERKHLRDAEAKRLQDEADAKTAADKAKSEVEEREFAEYAKELSTTWIEARKDKYPTLHATKMGPEIAKRVRAKFLETGEMPNEEEIASAVEAELDTVIESVYGTSKWSEKLAQKFKPPPPVRKTEPPTFSVTRKAISQDMAAGIKPPPTKPLTREQKREMLARMPDDEWNKRVSAARSLRATAGGGSGEE